jgi:hypothetical protein
VWRYGAGFVEMPGFWERRKIINETMAYIEAILCPYKDGASKYFMHRVFGRRNAKSVILHLAEGGSTPKDAAILLSAQCLSFAISGLSDDNRKIIHVAYNEGNQSVHGANALMECFTTACMLKGDRACVTFMMNEIEAAFRGLCAEERTAYHASAPIDLARRLALLERAQSERVKSMVPR